MVGVEDLAVGPLDRVRAQGVLEVDRYPVLFKHVGERFVRQLLDRRHPVATKLLQLVEGVVVEVDQLAHA